MKVILYMAMSVNGIIASPQNEEDFLSHYNWQMLCSLAKTYKCFIWGRKTYEIVTKWDREYFTEDIQKARKIIVSSQKIDLQKGYTLASSPREALNILEKKGHSTAIITGGSNLNTSFAKENLIDEVIINIEGVIVGKGIPLFSPNDFQLQLTLISIEKFEENGVTLKYKVNKISSVLERF